MKREFVPFDMRPILCWSVDENRYAVVNVLAAEIEHKEQELGKLVTNPGLVRALHIAFVRYIKEHGEAPDIVRCELSPTVDYAYCRVGIDTMGGHVPSNLNAYFARPRIFVAA